MGTRPGNNDGFHILPESVERATSGPSAVKRTTIPPGRGENAGMHLLGPLASQAETAQRPEGAGE